MPQEEAEKYLGLLKKALSGTLGRNLIDIVFSTQQVADSEEHRLLGGEYDVDEVFSQRTGQFLLQKAQILLGLLLRHHAQGFVQIGNDLFTAVDIASINTADGAFFRAKTAPQLRKKEAAAPFSPAVSLILLSDSTCVPRQTS